MPLDAQTTIREAVVADFRAAAVFDRHGIDFCCGGRRTIVDACRDRHLQPDAVLKELAEACATPRSDDPNYAEWEPDTLAAFIVGHHHAYVRRALPSITARTQKVAAVHGERHPELLDVARLWAGVAEDMTVHMAKEEAVLFPYVAVLATAARTGRAVPPPPFGAIENPIRVMEAEHDATGDAMAGIRSLTDGYTAPADACATYRICLQELEEFERDLHVHVHLENNVLFPKAKSLGALRP